MRQGGLWPAQSASHQSRVAAVWRRTGGHVVNVGATVAMRVFATVPLLRSEVLLPRKLDDTPMVLTLPACGRDFPAMMPSFRRQPTRRSVG